LVFFTINLYNFILFILNNCFKNIFLNYHRRILRRTQAVGISQRVEKYLLHMPLSPTSTSTVLVRQYFTESCKIFTAYATITDDIIPSVIYRCKYRRNYSVGIFPEGIFFGSLFSSTQPSMFFFLPTESGITNDLYADGLCPSGKSFVKFLPMECESYADGKILSVKLLNVVVEEIKELTY